MQGGNLPLKRFRVIKHSFFLLEMYQQTLLPGEVTDNENNPSFMEFDNLCLYLLNRTFVSKGKNNQVLGAIYPPVPPPWRLVSRKMKYKGADFFAYCRLVADWDK